MNLSPWRQVHIAFPDWAQAESVAAAHLAPLLAAAEGEGLIESWFFVRKSPSWRLRYLPAPGSPDADVTVAARLAALDGKHGLGVTAGIVYEPETHAFGGSDAMAGAHRLFHRDSRRLLPHLTAPANATTGHRRELSILLCTSLLRAAGLDWYEQGDVWARVADHRDPPDHIPRDRLPALEDSLRRLMSADITGMTGNDGALASADWASAYTCAGQELAHLAATGQLHRGLRAVLAHHIIFAWNRHGLPHATQAALAHTAKTVVFGADPSTGREPSQGGEPCMTPARR